jgi:ketosteroid isomerase-like protein
MMSEEQNRRIVEGLFEAFGRGDVPSLLGLLSEDIDWRIQGPASVPYFGQHNGHEGVSDFLTKLGTSVEMERFEPREFITDGDKVVVLGGERGRVRATGRLFDNDWAMVFTLREGKITSFRSYEDTGAVAGAFGPQG